MSGIKSTIANSFHSLGIGRLARALTSQKLVIFNYHRIRADGAGFSDFDDTVFGPTRSEFKEHVAWIKSQSRILGEDELLRMIDDPSSARSLPNRLTMITFDDGYRDNYELAYPVLRDLGVSAFFFIPTGTLQSRRLGWWDLVSYVAKKTELKQVRFRDRIWEVPNTPSLRQALASEWIGLLKSEQIRNIDPETTSRFVGEISTAAEVALPSAEAQSAELMTWDQIRELSNAGFTIGSHAHSHRILSSLDLSEQEKELRISKEILESEIKKPVRSLAFPVGGYDHFHRETQEFARAAGYRTAFSFMTGANDPAKIDRYDVRRIAPPSTIAKIDFQLSLPRFASRGKCDLKGPSSFKGPK